MSCELMLFLLSVVILFNGAYILWAFFSRKK